MAATHFRNALHLSRAPESGWTPQVLTYSGFYNIGVKEIWICVCYIDFVRKNGYFEHRRNEQAKYWMYETINEHLRDSFYQNPEIASLLPLQEKMCWKGGPRLSRQLETTGNVFLRVEAGAMNKYSK